MPKLQPTDPWSYIRKHRVEVTESRTGHMRLQTRNQDEECVLVRKTEDRWEPCSTLEAGSHHHSEFGAWVDRLPKRNAVQRFFFGDGTPDQKVQPEEVQPLDHKFFSLGPSAEDFTFESSGRGGAVSTGTLNWDVERRIGTAMHPMNMRF